jgi:hypothetical protein
VEATVPLRLRIHLLGLITTSVEARTLGHVANLVADSVADAVEAGVTADGEGADPEERVWSSVGAYYEASWLSGFSFLNGALAPNALQALAHFNQMVSGYWLGTEIALLVRRPNVLSLDARGRLHSPTGRAISYHDGWGCYAWHGVRVPEQVILAPERLSRDDFLNERNGEVRRVIQERMGSRFVPEMGGVVLDRGPQGTLYEVRLPADDPESTARYVLMQDASSGRQYFLRVPPRVQTAAEGVAWSYQLAAEEYGPAHET